MVVSKCDGRSLGDGVGYSDLGVMKGMSCVYSIYVYM